MHTITQTQQTIAQRQRRAYVVVVNNGLLTQADDGNTYNSVELALLFAKEFASGKIVLDDEEYNLTDGITMLMGEEQYECGNGFIEMGDDFCTLRIVNLR